MTSFPILTKVRPIPSTGNNSRASINSMPQLSAFSEYAEPPRQYDFESIRLTRQNPFDEAKGASHVLVPHQTRTIVSALRPELQRIDAFSAEPLFGKQTLYWKPQLIQGYDSEGPSLVEVMRTFSLDPNEDEVLWLFMMSKLPPFFSKHFSSTVPSLWQEMVQGRFAIVDKDRNVLVTAHEQWRDGDQERGVTMQYVVKDREHPMWKQALWTAFCLRP